MKIEDYNPKAREAFGKSLVDIGVSIFKSIILLFTIVPTTLLLKGAFDAESKKVSVFQMFDAFSVGTYLLFLAFLVLSFVIGHFFRKGGLHHIHESENCDKNS